MDLLFKCPTWCLQNAVSKAKSLVLIHQEYQRELHVFEDWLEQEQTTLASLTHPEGNVDTIEETLHQLQVLICNLSQIYFGKGSTQGSEITQFLFVFFQKLLQDRCSNGQSLLSSVLTSRERVIPWGVPQIEDRALDTAQREWGSYQVRLEETQTHMSSTLIRLKQMGQKFLSLAQWLEEMEKMANIRQQQRSDRATKESQLKQLQVREKLYFFY